MALRDTNTEYNRNLRRWGKMRQSIGGEDDLKENHVTDYIPDFTDSSDGKQSERYKKYITRALYINYTGWTHQGLVGSIFRKEPRVELPPNLEYLSENADGTGQGIVQVAKEICAEPLTVGRVGLLVDYPHSEGAQSLEEEQTNKLEAKISQYKAEDIYNWRTKTRNGNLIYTQIRLNEVETVVIDEFTDEVKKRTRVLGLDEGGYYQQLYDEFDTPIGERIEPKRQDGSRFDEIPFIIVGSEDNRPDIDKPPLLDIANVNLAHFRNSADQEDNLFMYSKATLFLTSDMSAEQFDSANPNGVVVGGESGHFLGANGSATLLQLQDASAISEAMTDKVKQMIALGARYIQESSSSNQTAEEARINASQRTSGLATLVNNCEYAINKCLEWCAAFMGDGGPIEFELNRDFYDKTLTAQEASVMIMFGDSGHMAKSDVRDKLRQVGWLRGDRTDEEIDNEVEIEPGLE